jgi:Ca2+-binding RTX toxin-like protein
MARRPARGLALAVTIALVGATEAQALPRATADRADEQAGKQIHVMYVLPSDRADRSLDTNGTLANSVDSFRRWLATVAAGQSLRLDTFQGEADITFRRMNRTDADLRNEGAFLRDAIEADLDAAGFNSANKIYAVYYDGTSDFACGGGAWPPTLPGNVAAMYLNGLPNSPVPCSSNPFAGLGGKPTYMEFAMLHEIIHTMGFVATCAPHHHLSGHVSDDADDLMWAGAGFWVPSGWAFVKLDAGHDDYYAHTMPSCPDLADSPFLAQFGPTCTRVGTVLDLHLAAGQSATLSRTASGAIRLNGGPCFDATTTNVSLISVGGARDGEALTLDLANGGFAPGATAEAGTAEIEFDVDLYDGSDALTIKGTRAVDTIRLGASGINLNGDGDADITWTSIEDHDVDAGAGNDVVSGAAHASVGAAAAFGLDLAGDGGNDTLTGGAAADSLAGFDGSDTLTGGAGADNEWGGAGNDVFKQEAAPNGADDMFGEAGKDKADYGQRGAAAPVTVTLNGGAVNDDGATTPAPEGDSADVEDVTGGAAPDSLTGSAANNALVGGLGNDALAGGDGVDTLTGGKGDDIELGGTGNDVFKQESANGADDLIGEAGNDKADYGARTAAEPVTVVLDGRATLGAGGGNDGTGAEGDDVSTERVTGGKAGDEITGDALANLLMGGLGDDILRGLGAKDTLMGEAGADELFGGDGNDRLDGGADTDACDGGPGTNTLANCP